MFVSILLAGLYVMATMGVFFLLDKEVAEFFYQIKNCDFVYVMKYVTRLGEATVYLAVALVIYLVHRKSKTDYARKALFFIAVVLVSGIVVNVAKGIIGRFRPIEWLKNGNHGFDNFSFLEYTANSFPSGHATTAFAIGISLMFLFPKYRMVFLLFAVTVALSRVALYQHYLSDVMVGAVVGSVTAYVLYQKMLQKHIFIQKGTAAIGSRKTL
jgi:membrane-associated phospholipid phosphatase